MSMWLFKKKQKNYFFTISHAIKGSHITYSQNTFIVSVMNGDAVDAWSDAKKMCHEKKSEDGKDWTIVDMKRID